MRRGARMTDSTTILPPALLLPSLALVLLAAAYPPADAGAQSAPIEVSSTRFAGTSIIEFENGSGSDIGQIRLWLPPDASLTSFKNEYGWTGRQNTVGVVIFVADTPVKPGGTVKFGIKSDTADTRINWKALDPSEAQIGIGTTQPTEIGAPAPAAPPPPQQQQQPAAPPQQPAGQGAAAAAAIREASSFRLIPDKPRVGDAIRVAGAGFGPNEALSFHINGEQAAAFETNSGGGFLITSAIPGGIIPSRVDFDVRDAHGNEKTVSLRVREAEVREAVVQDVPLTMEGLPGVIHRGDLLTVTGTAKPGSTVTARILGPEGNLVTTDPRPVDGAGDWSFETIMPQDTPYGRYEAVITDGFDTITREWSVESSKTIEIEPTTQVFKPGELMRFSGTAIAGEPIEFILENPQGTEVFSDIKQVDASGMAEFAYQTEQSTQEGTYVLIAKQGDSTEIILAGLGERPREHIVAKMDKLNYKKSDVATINIDGPASATLSLLVIDPSDRQKFVDNRVVLRPDGKQAYDLDLKDYASGIYTLVLSRANTKTTETFSVGLQFGSGQIDIRTTKHTYKTSDPVLVLGETNANVLLTLQLIDPGGAVVKEKETFTNKDGRIVDGSFRIPANGGAGIWVVKASSGQNFATTELEVVATVQEGMLVTISGIRDIPGIGRVVDFAVIGAQNTVVISITNRDGGEIGKELTFPASQDGTVSQPWPIPRELPPGVYTITARDAVDSASAEFTLG